MKKLLKSIVVFFSAVSFATATPIKVPSTKSPESLNIKHGETVVLDKKIIF